MESDDDSSDDDGEELDTMEDIPRVVVLSISASKNKVIVKRIFEGFTLKKNCLSEKLKAKLDLKDQEFQNGKKNSTKIQHGGHIGLLKVKTDLF